VEREAAVGRGDNKAAAKGPTTPWVWPSSTLRQRRSVRSATLCFCRFSVISIPLMALAKTEVACVCVSVCQCVHKRHILLVSC
jgi:hypothetical protein